MLQFTEDTQIMVLLSENAGKSVPTTIVTTDVARTRGKYSIKTPED